MNEQWTVLITQTKLYEACNQHRSRETLVNVRICLPKYVGLVTAYSSLHDHTDDEMFLKVITFRFYLAATVHISLMR
jgi:hypothetical protein